MENQTNISINRKELLTTTLIRAKADFRGDNRKILGMSAKSEIVGYESLAGAVKVSVKTAFRLVFRSEEGVFSHETVETEQTETVRCEPLTATSHLCLRSAVTGFDRIGGSLSATVEISGWFIAENTVAALSSCIPDVCCKTTTFRGENVERLLPGGLSLTYTDESRMNVQSLIDYAVEANVTSIQASGGSYRVEGDVYVRIFACGEDGQCFTQLFTHSFSTEIADESVSSDQTLDVDATVKQAELSLADGDKRLLICDVVLSFGGCATSFTETETVADAFSTTNEVRTTGENVTVNQSFCLRSIREKVTTKIEPAGGVNELYGVLDPAVSASYSTNNGNVFVEGLIEADVLYLSGKDVAEGQKIEAPFKVSLPIDYKCETKLQPKVIVTSIAAKARGNEVDLAFELMIRIEGVSSETVFLLSGLEKGAAKEENDFAVSLYIVRPGETLWDVAKALNTAEETLLRQNPDVPLPLREGEKVILFRELPFDRV